MTVVSPIGDDDELQMQKTEEISSSSGEKTKSKTTAEVKPAKEPWSNAGAPIADRFVLDDPEYIARHRTAIGFQKKLGSKQFSTFTVFGFDYPTEELTDEYLKEMSMDFSTLIGLGNVHEASTVFKNLPPAIQLRVLRFIVEGFSTYNASLDAFFRKVVRENNLKGSDVEDLQKVSALKSQPNLLKSLYDNVDRLKQMSDTLVSMTDQVFGQRASEIQAAQVLKQFPPDVVRAYDELNQLLAYSETRVGKIIKEFSEHTLTLEEVGSELSMIVVLLDTAMNSFQAKLQSVSFQPNKKSKVSMTTFAQALDDDRHQVNCQVATAVRDIYEGSQGSQVVVLTQEAYALVTRSLQQTGQVGLAAQFCETNPVVFQQPEDLSFVFEASYDLVKPDVLQNLAVPMKYIYAMFKTDSELREKKKEELLADLRQLEKFLEEYKQSVRNSLKQISSAKQREKMIAYVVFIAQLKNVVTALQNAVQKGFHPGISDPAGYGLHWHQLLLEEAQWKKTAQLVYGITQDQAV